MQGNQHLLVYNPGKFSQCVWAADSSTAELAVKLNLLAPLMPTSRQVSPLPCHSLSLTLPTAHPLSSHHHHLQWGGFVQKDTVKDSSKKFAKKNLIFRWSFCFVFREQLCQTCPGLSMKYVTCSAKNTNAEKYFKCLYNSWCITCFLLKGKIINWAQITKMRC